uniref:Uncharacterized protein n=1 Tax=Parascaris univalens TaxID=6257 RepID=A0A914ZLR6_PARUN
MDVTLNTSRYTTMKYLSEPEHVPEDHMTFLFGVIMLLCVATVCILLASRVSPRRYGRSKSSFIVFLGAIQCANDNSTNTTTSFVSTPLINVAPSYDTMNATAAIASPRPPPYEQFLLNIT